MKQYQKTRRANMLFTLAALVVVLMSNVYVGRAQTNELPDTVWTKFTYPYEVRALKFTPGGKYLASGGSDAIPRLWDAETGELIHEFPGRPTGIWNISIFEDKIAFIGPLENGVQIYNLDNYELITSLVGSDCGEFSHDGKFIILGTNKSISIFETSSWSLVKRINLAKPPTSISISDDSRHLAIYENYYSLQNDDKIGNILIFTIPDLQFVKTLDKKEYLYCPDLDFSPDNLHLAGALFAEPNKIWNTSDWSLKSEIGNGGDSKAIEFSPDNKYVVTGISNAGKINHSIFIFDVENKKMIYSYFLNYFGKYFGNEYGDVSSSISINSDGKQIAIAGGAGIYMLNAKWNATSVEEESIQILEPEIFPNPNDGKAIIRFNLLKNSEVSVNIYDINSRLISNIFKGQLNSGIQSFEWLAKVPIGMYFARISSGKTVSSIKIIVQR